jgi:hypothetical protein
MIRYPYGIHIVFGSHYGIFEGHYAFEDDWEFRDGSKPRYDIPVQGEISFLHDVFSRYLDVL